MLEVNELVKYLRLSVKVQDPDNLTVNDSKYLEMSDEDLILFLKVVATRDFPQLHSLEEVTSDMVYPITLLAKKELYHTLAVKEAPLVNMVADNNNQLLRGQRFEHYMKLIAQIEAEYENFIADGGAGGYTLSTFDVLLTQRYATKRNYDKGQPPALSAFISKVKANSVEIGWEFSTNLYFNTSIYISRGDIYDPCGMSDEDKILSGATLVKKLYDAKQTHIRISGLKPNTSYKVLVVVSNMTLLKSYAELSFTTEDLNISSYEIAQNNNIPTLGISRGEV